MEITRIHPDRATDQDPTLSEYADARAAFNLADQRLKAATAALKTKMADSHSKSISWSNDEGMTRKVTYVAPERVEFDEKALRRALTAKVYDRYTTKKLNRSALEDAMNAGLVDKNVVAKHIKLKPAEPFLKYTEGETP